MGHQNMNRSTTVHQSLVLGISWGRDDIWPVLIAPKMFKEIWYMCVYCRAIFSAKDPVEWNSEFHLWCLEFPVGSIIRSLKFWWYPQFFADFPLVCNENILMTYLLEISPLNFLVKMSTVLYPHIPRRQSPARSVKLGNWRWGRLQKLWFRNFFVLLEVDILS